MKQLIFIILLFSFCINSNAQKRKKGVEFIGNVDKLKKAQSVVWYGWDFSNLKITDPKQFDDAIVIKEKHIPSIIGLLNAEFPSKYVKRRLKVNELKTSLDEIQIGYRLINEEKLVTFEEFEFLSEDIKQIVQSYSLKTNTGIGFVVIVENFNKSKRFTTAYPTFFDIETREVLYTTKMKGLPGSKWGYSRYWYEGLLETFHYYFKYYNRTVNK